jgi:hypothetical protein
MLDKLNRDFTKKMRWKNVGDKTIRMYKNMGSS